MCSTADVSFLSPTLQPSSNALGLHFLKFLWSDCCGRSYSTNNGTDAATNTCSKQFCAFLSVSLATTNEKAQVAASNVEGHVDKPAALAKHSRDVNEVASRVHVWLVLEESRYDTIASGRL